MKSMQIRSEFTKLILSTRKLHIKKGRDIGSANRKDPSDRVCTYCTTELSEDECHFVMKGPLYGDYGSTMFMYMRGPGSMEYVTELSLYRFISVAQSSVDAALKVMFTKASWFDIIVHYNAHV